MERFHIIRSQMEKVFENGDYAEVEKLAHEYLTIAASKSADWNYGNAIHHANLLLGRISLKKGDVVKAKYYLLEAGKTPGSPQLNSFGPNMTLAKELLELGEKEIVLTYLEGCEKFWDKSFADQKIQAWKSAINKGEIPDFQGNLVY